LPAPEKSPSAQDRLERPLPAARLALIDQIPTTGYPRAPRAEPSAPSAAERLQSIGEALADRGFRVEVARGLSDVAGRTAANILGGPVDLAALALRPLGYQHPAPVGGSEWIGQGMESAGVVTPERRPATEVLATLSAPGAMVGAARGLSRLAEMGPGVAPSAGRFGAGVSAVDQLGAISPEGKARLLADLQAGKGSGTYRLGDVTEWQAQGLERLFGRPVPSREVFMTDRATDHLLAGRVGANGFTPEEVARFAEQSMAGRARPDMNVAKGGQNPSLLNTGLRDPVTGRPYDARMPLRQVDEGYEVRSVIPEGYPRSNKAPKR